MFSILLLAIVEAQAQLEKNYRPRPTHNATSAELITGLRQQRDEALETIESPRKAIISQIYTRRTNYLIKKVKEGLFIKDDSLQQFVDTVFKKIVGANTISPLPKRVLILREPAANAICYGEGTLMVTVGLLSQIRNESQLAFILAHEIAHYALHHVRERIITEVNQRIAKTTKREVSKILHDEVSVEELEALRNLIYEVTRHSRQNEIAADSLGVILLHNTGYNEKEALSVLSVLDSSDIARHTHGDALYLPLHSDKYPFQEYWLKPRLSVYSKQYTTTFIFATDSVASHPDIALRQVKLKPLIKETDRAANMQSVTFLDYAIHIGNFESIESAYTFNQYDRCLFLALQLKTIYPKNAYLVSIISKVLSFVYKTKEDDSFNMWVPRYTGHYSKDLRRVNDFLNNLTVREVGEITFHFLNNKNNFNPDEEEHYYLLWNICKLTQRNEVSQKIKDAYRAKFGKGKYWEKMTFL